MMAVIYGISKEKIINWKLGIVLLKKANELQ